MKTQNKKSACSPALAPTLVALAIAKSLVPGSANAATIEVDHPLDNNGEQTVELPNGDVTIDIRCSLREAIVSMNTKTPEPGCFETGVFGTDDQINSAQALNFSLEDELSITTDAALTINLVGSTITGAGNHRIIDVMGSPNLMLENVTISNGNAPDNGDRYTDTGGGIRAQNSSISLDNLTVSGNFAPYGAGGIGARYSNVTINNSTFTNNTGRRGGAIYARGANANRFELRNSTVNGNFAEDAGGLHHEGGTADIINSTISQNTSNNYAAVVISYASVANISHTTLFDNVNNAGRESAIYVQGYNTPGSESTATLSNSVISGASPLCRQRPNNEAQSLLLNGGGNWFQDATCNGAALGDPKLGPLRDNGGPTQTLMPTLTSPLRDFATSNCAMNDQRGRARRAQRCAPGAADLIMAEIVVDSASDLGANCTLREALASTSDASIQAGCSSDIPIDGADGRSIVFHPNLTGGNITLNGSELPILSNQIVEINPTGVQGITLDGDKASRVFRIQDSRVSLNRLTIQNGLSAGYPDGGGGIRAQDASLYIVESTIKDNTIGTVGLFRFDDKGGGIFTQGGSISIDASTISNNLSGNLGGGLFIRESDFLMINSTISNNRRPAYELTEGSGLAVSGDSPLVLNSTILNDIMVYRGNPNRDDLSLQNSIVQGTCQGIVDDPFIMDEGGNIFSNTSCTGTANGNPGLLPLADNGGLTQTHALEESSPARGAGILATCTRTDQRGNIRNDGDGRCDAGSFELLNSEVPVNFFTIPLSNGKAVVVPL